MTPEPFPLQPCEVLVSTCPQPEPMWLSTLQVCRVWLLGTTKLVGSNQLRGVLTDNPHGASAEWRAPLSQCHSAEIDALEHAQEITASRIAILRQEIADRQRHLEGLLAHETDLQRARLQLANTPCTSP